ncbi:MAG: hypothetical protein EAZ44_06230 [Cytophagia bacterium]|nr:MAG: hypothetical protein EAZ44_06230 [Cytophagia bacterium]TAG37944.1 MAG: hypothetical protein EAZ31_10960 [Cytophagia bacterium]
MKTLNIITQSIISNKDAVVDYHVETSTLICEVLAEFTSRENFINLFTEMGEFIKKNNVKKLIFDKRNMRIFDQTSMEWYHVEWKTSMKKYGLSVYRKILPNDFIFEKSVELGRLKIAKENPAFKFEDFDIQYCKTVEEAMEK